MSFFIFFRKNRNILSEFILFKANPEECEDDPEPGLRSFCRAAIESYYYNKTTKECIDFLYGGCGATKNYFKTRESCKQTCLQRSVQPAIDKTAGGKALCYSNPSPNFRYCFQYIPAYFYDIRRNECYLFYYGGCRLQSPNIFGSRAECEQSCKQKLSNRIVFP